MDDFKKIKQKLSAKKSEICVVGMGYIGLPTALHYAKNNLKVVGLDINEELVAELGEGRIRMEEEGLGELAREYLPSIDLKTSYESTDNCDVAVLCLPSPIYRNITSPKVFGRRSRRTSQKQKERDTSSC